jgi:hypothetical protein
MVRAESEAQIHSSLIYPHVLSIASFDDKNILCLCPIIYSSVAFWGEGRFQACAFGQNFVL